VLLPESLRDRMVDSLDEVLTLYRGNTDPEMVAGLLLEQLETFADDQEMDDWMDQMETSGDLEAPLQQALEDEFSRAEPDLTGEEVVSLFEKLCNIEWSDSTELGDDETDDVTFF